MLERELQTAIFPFVEKLEDAEAVFAAIHDFSLVIGAQGFAIDQEGGVGEGPLVFGFRAGQGLALNKFFGQQLVVVGECRLAGIAVGFQGGTEQGLEDAHFVIGDEFLPPEDQSRLRSQAGAEVAIELLPSFLFADFSAQEIPSDFILGSGSGDQDQQ